MDSSTEPGPFSILRDANNGDATEMRFCPMRRYFRQMSRYFYPCEVKLIFFAIVVDCHFLDG